MHTTGKGMAYSFDILISVLFLFLALVVGSNHVLEITAREYQWSEQAIRMEYARALVDSIVKNHDSNGLQGNALFDKHKQRTLQNETSIPELEKLSKNPNIFGVWVRSAYKTRHLFEAKAGSKTCFSVERFVLVNHEKNVLGVKVCE